MLICALNLENNQKKENEKYAASDAIFYLIVTYFELQLKKVIRGDI